MEVSETASDSAMDSGRVKHRWVALIAVGAVGLTGAGFGVSLLIKSPAQAAVDSQPPAPSVITAPVEYRTLASSMVLRGTVVASQSVEITPSGGAGDGGSPTVSKLPLKMGDQVQAGRLLVEISGRPVISLQGTVPLYRDLKPGAQGSDVAQLQDSLRRLGHSTSPDVSGRFGEGTKSAVTALYKAVGYEPIPAGGAEGSAAVSAAEAQVTSAERALEDAKDALKNSEAGSGKGSAEATAPATRTAEVVNGRDPEPLRRTVKRAQEDLTTAREGLVGARAAAGPMVPSGEVTFLESFPARVQDLPVRLGGKVQGAVMTVAAGPLVVHGFVPDHQKGLIREGQKAEILSEANGATVSASVGSIAATRTTPRTDGGTQAGQPAGPVGGQGSGDGYLMTLTPGQPLEPEWTGQNVRLTVLAASTGGRVLVVPVTAVSAGADGSTAVTVLENDGRQRRVRVKPGTTGDGHLEVTPLDGGDLSEGDHVVMGIRADPAVRRSTG
ncbi:peptidoglycan-binding protein [Streptomyces erythrochromogenes]|uniref:peptidoglycan-binding protein n=1 Tax=Streptomyces erythrochromogenes TaxID=285574 RepID=UPI0037FAD894